MSRASRPLSRTASLSTTVSSRSSSAELVTPTIRTSALPTLRQDETIVEWISSVSTEGLADQIQLSKKRSRSDSHPCGTGKRVRLSEPVTSWPLVASSSPSFSSRSLEKQSFELFDQFDFSLPPAASVGSDLILGEPLNINLFEYADWAANESDGILPCDLCASNFSCKWISLFNLTHL